MRISHFLSSMVIASTLSLQAQAQITCGPIFSEGLSFSVGAFEASNQNNPAKVPDLLAKILAMSASTMGESLGPKFTLEKGHIVLGKPLKEGWSMELEYIQDMRTTEVTYRLAEILLVKPNGERTKISKAPTTADGLQLSKTHMTPSELLTDADAFRVLQNIEAPTVIRGELWKALNKWIPYVEFANRSTLREIEAHKLATVKSGAFVRSNWDFTKKVIRKQSFKFALLAAVMYAYTERTRISNEIFVSDPWESILKNSKISQFNKQEQSHLSDLLTNLLKIDRESLDMAEPTKKARASKNSYHDLSSILSKTRNLSQLEKKAGGNQFIYLFRNNKIDELGTKKITDTLSDDSSEEPYMIIFYHPSMKRILLVAGDQTLETDDGEMKFFTIGLDPENENTLYRLIRNRLTPSERNAE
ncbi:hypothetical protein D3C87_242030 [compost metagenome]